MDALRVCTRSSSSLTNRQTIAAKLMAGLIFVTHFKHKAGGESIPFLQHAPSYVGLFAMYGRYKRRAKREHYTRAGFPHITGYGTCLVIHYAL